MKVLSKISFVFLVLLMMGGCGASEAKMSVEPALADEDPITVTQEKTVAETQPAEEKPSTEKSRPARIDQPTQKKQAEGQQQDTEIQQVVDAKQAALEKPTEDKQQAALEKPTEDKQQTALEKPTEDKQQAALEKPTEDKQQAALEKPTEDKQQAALEKPTEDKQQAALEKPTEDKQQAALEKPTEDKQQAAQEKPTEDKQQTAVNQQAVNQTAADKKSQQEQDIQEDENRVLASVDGQELIAWQANLLLERGFARDLLDMVQNWINIKTKATEARRMGLDKIKENVFSLQFRADFDLSSYFLDMYFRDRLPQPEEELLRQEYDKNIDTFQSPMKADIQHISVMQRDLAEEIFNEAENQGVKFDVLVEKYSRAKNKATKGRLYGTSYEFLEEALGPKVAEAVSNSRSNIILEPVMGRNGYEVIKVHSLVPRVNITYEDVRENIKKRLFGQTVADAMTKFEEEAKTKVKIVKSEEILKLEKEAQENAPPGTIRPPKIIK